MASLTPSLPDRIRGWRRRLRALLRGSTTEREMSDELAFHLDMETAKNIRAGMTAAEARRAALLAFGGVSGVAEQVREVRKVAWFDDLVQDLRHAARGFRRGPGFTAAAVAALSLGIGANTAVFSVVHAVIIAPLPYANADRLLRLWETNPAQGIAQGSVSPGTFVDLRARSRTLERIAVFTERDFIVTAGGESWEARAAAVSPVLFEMLGFRPVIGRVWTPDNDRSRQGATAGEVVISHELWKRRFGGDPAIAGRMIRMDYRWSYVIVGVLPPGFAFPTGVDLWTSLTYPATVSATERQFRYHGSIAQLRAGYTLEQAAKEVSGIAAQLESEYPASNAGWTVTLMRLDRSIVGDTRPTLLILLALAGCVLLVACGNVATLAIARATARQHETAVRVALGAGRRRLLRQWGAEGLLLALLGGFGGVVVGRLSNRLLLTLAPGDIPRIGEVTFDGPVLVFALFLTCVTAVIIGLAPALRLRHARPLDAMRSRTSGGEVRARTREWLVGGQMALTMILTVAAALLLRSFVRLESTDLGYRRHDILSAEVRVPLGRFVTPRPWFQRVQFYDAMMADLATIPGIRSVAGTTNVPLSSEVGSGSMWRIDAPGARGRRPPTSAADQWKAGIQIVTPAYFETMDIPVVRGRGFTDADRFTQQELTDPDVPRPVGVAMINEAMAQRFWPDANPLGEQIFLFDDQTFAAYRTIIGVVRDVRAESVAAAAAPTVFLPFAQHSGRGLSLVLRTDLPPVQLVSTVTNRLHAFDPAVSVASVRPLDDVISGVLARPRFTMLLVGCFAALSLIIAAVGIFGIVGFLVTRRTHEIGIRMALGAQRSSVLWLVVREGGPPVMLGIACGCIGATVVARAMQALLYGLAPLDAASFTGAAAVLLVVSIIAAAVPATRAAALDPLQSLRAE